MEICPLIILNMNKKKILLAIFVIFFGVSFRIFLNKVIRIPNFEAVTALSLISGSFFGGTYAFFIPLSMIFLSDIYFGNSLVYLFTWSAFILIGIFGTFLKRDSKYYLFEISGGGILSVLFFYLWTNFGWWITSRMYSMNFQGLITCYIAGLPFLKNQLASILIFTPVFSIIFSLVFDKIFIKKTKKYENFAFVSKIS